MVVELREGQSREKQVLVIRNPIFVKSLWYHKRQRETLAEMCYIMDRESKNPFELEAVLNL